MRIVFTTLFVSISLASAMAEGDAPVPVAIDGGSLEWNIPGPRVVRSGDTIVVEIPAGMERDNGRATATLPGHLYEGRGDGCLRFTIHAKGTGVGKPLKKYRGVKFMARIDDAGGGRNWVNTAHRMGDWEDDLSFVCGFGGAAPTNVVLYLGLEDCAGRIEFTLSSLRVEAIGEIQPPVNRDYEVKYPLELSGHGAFRGAVLPMDIGKITEDDFATLESWGANLARYQICRNWRRPFAWEDNGEYDAYLEGALDTLEKKVLPWADRHGISIILDLHATPGARNAVDENRIFTEERYARHFVEVWERIARRFKGDRRFYGYELVNEPVQQGPTPFSYYRVQEAAARAIRAVDPDATIIVAANGFGHPSGFASLSPLAMDNVIYTVHCYAPTTYTMQGMRDAKRDGLLSWPDPEKGWDREFLRKRLEPVLEFSRRHDARILVGEFSAIAWAPGAENYLRDCIAVFEEYGWDWCYHAFREWDGWSVEKTWLRYDEAARRDIHGPSADNPRKRALLEGLGRNAAGRRDSGPDK